MNIQFMNPQALYLLLLIIPVATLTLWGSLRRRALLSSFGQISLLRQFSKIPDAGPRLSKVVLVSLATALAVVALARPVIPEGSTMVKQGSLDLVAMIDVSRSMAAEDYAPSRSRLEKAKASLKSVLDSLKGNRVGMVTFASEPFIQAELTEDLKALGFVLDNWVSVGSAPGDSTNIAPALKEALALFDNAVRDKLILLFSDGGDDMSDELLKVVAELKAKNIKILAAGMGSIAASKIPVYDSQGQFKSWYKVNNQPALTSLNESPLKYISSNTGGNYARVGPATNLGELLLKPALSREKLSLQHRELFQLFLILALAALLAENVRERISGYR